MVNPCPKCGRSMTWQYAIGFGSVPRYVCGCGFDTHHVKIITDNKVNISIDGRRGFSKGENYE